MSNTDLERWKSIEGYEGYYDVSDLGRVRSYDRLIERTGQGSYILPGRIMRQTPDKDGYFQVTLNVGGKPRTRKVNRLVLMAFRPEGFAVGLEGDHRNGIRSDNNLGNLRWATVVQNRLNNHVIRNATGVRGVRFWPNKKNPWQAYVSRKGYWRSLGHFATKEAAAAVRAPFNDGVLHG